MWVGYLESLEHGHVVDEALVHDALLVRDLVDDAPEGLSVHRPQGALAAGQDGRRSRLVVEERQLPEAALLIVRVHQLLLVVLTTHEHVEQAAETLVDERYPRTCT